MKLAFLLLNILNVGILAASLVSLLPTAMMFDAPGSEKKGLWFLAGVFALFPFVAFASLLIGWIKWSADAFVAALKWGAVAPVYAAFAAICLFSILDR